MRSHSINFPRNLAVHSKSILNKMQSAEKLVANIMNSTFLNSLSDFLLVCSFTYLAIVIIHCNIFISIRNVLSYLNSNLYSQVS